MMEYDTAVCYIADALRMTAENTANLSGGRYITSSLADRLFDSFSYGQLYGECDGAESADEIIGRIRKKLKG